MNDLAQQASNVTLLGAVFLICMAFLTTVLPRTKAVLPLLVTTCYMPLGQMFMVAGLHFQFFRILLLIGWMRVLFRREAEAFKLTRLDKVFIWWAVATLVLGTLTSPSFERFINRCGEVYNAVGAYFLFRCWIRSTDEVIGTIRFLALMIVPLAASMIVEKFTAHNIFSVFGGVPELTQERDGELRCQGAFRHPILAGTYAATLFPLFCGLWLLKTRNRLRSLIGISCATIVTVAASSSGALLTLVAAVLAFAAWSWRNHMRQMRWAIVLAIIALACVMKAPVWYLIARVSEVTGGSGWHRSFLIDQAIHHFNEWWLVGSTYTAHWAPGGQVLAVDPNNMDITNNYIAEGLQGGVLKLGLFLALIVIGFKTVGRAVRAQAALPRGTRLFTWSMGVCLFTHCISFVSVSYFDQIVIMWYFLLASCSMLISELQTTCEPVMEAEPEAVGIPSPAETCQS